MSIFRTVIDSAVSRHTTPAGGQIAYGPDPDPRSPIRSGEEPGIAAVRNTDTGTADAAGPSSLIDAHEEARSSVQEAMWAYFDENISAEDYSRARANFAAAPAALPVHCPEITGGPVYTAYYDPHVHSEEAAEIILRRHAAAEAGELHVIEYLPPAGSPARPQEPVYIRDVYGHCSREHLLSLAADMEKGL